LLGALLAGASAWLAVTNNPPARVVVREAWRAARGLLVAVFQGNPFAAQAGQAPDAAHAALAGVVAGLGQGLGIGGAGQSLAWPYLLQPPGWPPVLPDVQPALWCASLWGTALGLGALFAREWSVLCGPALRWLRGRGRAGDPGGVQSVPGWPGLLAAAIPCLLLQWRLQGWATRWQAPATVGLLLVLSGQILVRSGRWAEAAPPGASEDVPPWLALPVGAAAGAGVLPGLSATALLLAGALYARVPAPAAARFALMSWTLAAAGLGVLLLPSALGTWSAGALAALVGAAAGAGVGGWTLLRCLGALRPRALPVLASYCSGLGALLVLLGVLGG
jgi:undecaprenyl pyrophosphate phosphatase UppP